MNTRIHHCYNRTFPDPNLRLTWASYPPLHLGCDWSLPSSMVQFPYLDHFCPEEGGNKFLRNVTTSKLLSIITQKAITWHFKLVHFLTSYFLKIYFNCILPPVCRYLQAVLHTVLWYRQGWAWRTQLYCFHNSQSLRAFLQSQKFRAHGLVCNMSLNL
jgi:hypothetical protein